MVISNGLIFTIPNILTLFRFIGAFAVLWLLAEAKGDTFLITVAMALTVVSAITDWFDGYLARRWNQVSELGTYLDPIADKALVYGVTVTLIFVYHIVPAWFLVVMGLRDCLVIGLAKAVAIAGKKFEVTFFAKGKTAIQDMFIIIGIAVVLFQPVSAVILTAWHGAVWCVGTLTLMTLVHYFWVNRRNLKVFLKEWKTS
ncbi:MAG TPA: CDP-alcohol phosphatidyltransferase family protein [Candidatus Paceibacterota bacterium]